MRALGGCQTYLDELLVAEADPCEEYLFTVKLQLFEGQKKGANVPW
jgi:hypothetical protein